jgi:hypothetical protein
VLKKTEQDKGTKRVSAGMGAQFDHQGRLTSDQEQTREGTSPADTQARTFFREPQMRKP